MIKRISLFVILMALAAPMAHAEFLVGASFGQGYLEGDRDGISFSGDDLAWKGYVGFRFAKFVGLELAYRDWGQQVDSGVIAQTKDVDLMVVGVLPIKKFEVFAKVGYARWDVDSAINNVPGSGRSEDGTDLVWGLGVAWKFNDLIAIRGEYEAFEISIADRADFWSVGIDFRF